MSFLKWPPKDPDEILDYDIDWTTRLASDTIVTSTWILPLTGGISKVSDTNTTTHSKIWLSGGTLNETVTLTNRVVTAAGRVMDQSVSLRIKVK